MSRTSAEPMREAELQDAVVEMAMMLGWKVMHTRPARTATGHWRTPLQGHRGFPDLCMVRPPRLIFAELKSASGKLTTEQENWLDALDKVAEDNSGLEKHRRTSLDRSVPETFVWTPRHWRDGLVEEALR